jgi:hypothetical protein
VCRASAQRVYLASTTLSQTPSAIPPSAISPAGVCRNGANCPWNHDVDPLDQVLLDEVAFGPSSFSGGMLGGGHSIDAGGVVGPAAPSPASGHRRCFAVDCEFIQVRGREGARAGGGEGERVCGGEKGCGGERVCGVRATRARGREVVRGEGMKRREGVKREGERWVELV